MTFFCTENGLCVPALYLILLGAIITALWGASWLLSKDKLTVKQWMGVVFGAIFGVSGILLLLMLMERT